jgi:hypothetical protein
MLAGVCSEFGALEREHPSKMNVAAKWRDRNILIRVSFARIEMQASLHPPDAAHTQMQLAVTSPSSNDVLHCANCSGPHPSAHDSSIHAPSTQLATVTRSSQRVGSVASQLVPASVQMQSAAQPPSSQPSEFRGGARAAQASAQSTMLVPPPSKHTSIDWSDTQVVTKSGQGSGVLEQMHKSNESVTTHPCIVGKRPSIAQISPHSISVHSRSMHISMRSGPLHSGCESALHRPPSTTAKGTGFSC